MWSYYLDRELSNFPIQLMVTFFRPATASRTKTESSSRSKFEIDPYLIKRYDEPCANFPLL